VGWTPDIEAFLPDKSERRAFLNQAALMVYEKKELRQALSTDTGKISFLRSLQKAAADRLSLNPQDGEACIIAYGDTIRYQREKNGLCVLANRTGAVEYIGADTVYEKDTLTLKRTAHGDDFELTPSQGERGRAKGYIAFVMLKSGRSFVKWMTRAQVEAHAKKYSKAYSQAGGAWQTSFDGMGEKTVINAILYDLHIAKVIPQPLAEEEEAIDVTPDAPAQKGASAADVEKQLADAGQTIIKEAVAAVAPAPDVKASAAPAAEQGELGLPGSAPDIF
jgi:phage RecT family recombinase